MHLELTEILACPACGPRYGLVAFVAEMEGRRIVAGRLDCPVCEARHEIRGGTVRMGEVETDAGESDRVGSDFPPPDQAEWAAIAAALLAPPGSRDVVLFAGGAEPLAAQVAETRPTGALVALGLSPAPPHDRVYSIVAPRGGRLPFRHGCLDGAVIRGADADLVERVAPTLRPGARLVVLSPAGGVVGPDEARLKELAADHRAWVGVRA